MRSGGCRREALADASEGTRRGKAQCALGRRVPRALAATVAGGDPWEWASASEVPLSPVLRRRL